MISELYTGTYTQPSVEDVALRRAALAPYDGWNERAFAAMVAWRGVPNGYLDLGSGTGAMVNMARKIGIEAYGVDLINGPERHFIHHDLSEPLWFYSYVPGLGDDWIVEDAPRWSEGVLKRFQWISCLEVAEHLPARAAPVLCDTIARHLAPGGLVVFSAAVPGQQGEHHVNCQPTTYWRDLLHARGISYRADYTKELALLWALTTGPASAWLGPNLQVFDTWDGEMQQEIG